MLETAAELDCACLRSSESDALPGAGGVILLHLASPPLLSKLPAALDCLESQDETQGWTPLYSPASPPPLSSGHQARTISALMLSLFCQFSPCPLPSSPPSLLYPLPPLPPPPSPRSRTVAFVYPSSQLLSSSSPSLLLSLRIPQVQDYGLPSEPRLPSFDVPAGYTDDQWLEVRWASSRGPLLGGEWSEREGAKGSKWRGRREFKGGGESSER